MKTKVEFYSVLRDITGAHEIEVNLPDGSPLAVLLGGLFVQFPKLAEWDEKLLFAANLDFVDRSHAIQPDETISIMPPAQGG
ncbi:MAG: MoaD/ThiS family protein [Chthoniobacterales bacterium]